MTNILKQYLRQMLKKVEIKESGDSSYLPGEMIDRIKFDNANEKLKLKEKIQHLVKEF